MRRRAIAVLVLVLAGLASACGSEPLSEEAYRSKLERLCSEVERDQRAAERGPGPVEERARRGAEAGERFRDAVRDLEPPDRLRAAHADLERRFDDFARVAPLARKDPDRALRLAEDLEVRVDMTLSRLGVPACKSDA